MKCQFLSDAAGIHFEDYGSRNHVTYSSVRQCEITDHAAPTYSIKYVTRGTEHYFLQNRRLPVSAGNFWLVNKECSVDVEIRSQRPVQGFCIHLHPGLVEDEYRSWISAEDSLLDDPFENTALPQLEACIYNYEENELGQYLRETMARFDRERICLTVNEEEFFRTLAYQLVRLQNGWMAEETKLHTLRNSTKKELLRRLQLAKERMDQQWGEDLDMDAIAKECLLSSSHLYHSFRKQYGTSPYQYLLNKRLKKAACLIGRSETSIADIASHCGFADGAAFAKSFKKLYGLPPKEFRKKGER